MNASHALGTVNTEIAERFPFLPSDVFREPRSEQERELRMLYACCTGQNAEAPTHVRRAAQLLMGQEPLPDGFLKFVSAEMALLIAQTNDPDMKAVSKANGPYFRMQRLIRKFEGSQPGVIPIDLGNAAKKEKQSLLNAERAGRRATAWHPELHGALRDEIATASSTEDHPKIDGVNREMSDRENQVLQLYNELISHPSIRNTYASDATKLLDICQQLAASEKTNIVITVGIGGSDSPVNARLPSYIVPALDLMDIFRRYKSNGILRTVPRIRITNAVHAATKINDGMDPSTVLHYGKQRTDFLQRFAGEFADTELFVEDDSHIPLPTDEDARLFDERADWPQNFHENDSINKQGVRMVATERMSGMPIEIARGRVLKYMMLHTALFFDVINGRHPHFGYPDGVMSIGGGGEKFFNVGRDRHTLQLHEDGNDGHFPPSVRLISSVGNNPPYYDVRGGYDTSLHAVDGVPLLRTPMRDDTGKTVQEDKAVQSDMKVLLEYIARVRKVSLAEADQIYRDFCNRSASAMNATSSVQAQSA